MLSNCYLLFLLLTIFSCTGKTVCYTELNDFINDESNNLTHKRENNGIVLELKYKPVSLMLADEYKSKAIDSIFERKNNSYSKRIYFILGISTDQKEIFNTKKGFSTISGSFELKKHIKLVTDGNETVRLVHSYLPNFLGLARKTQVLLIFNKPIKDFNRINIVIDELGIGISKQVIKFNKADIENIPSLNYDC